MRLRDACGAILALGAHLFLVADRADASGLHLHHLKARSAGTVAGFGVAPVTSFGVAPMASYSVAPMASYSVAPMASYSVAPVAAVPAASFGVAPLTTGYPMSSFGVAPQVSFGAAHALAAVPSAVPATSFAHFGVAPLYAQPSASLSTPLVSLSALPALSSGGTFGALAAGGVSPLATAEMQATAAYPALSTVAHAQGLPASLFINLLRSALRNVIGDVVGGGGSPSRDGLRQILTSILQGFLGTPGIGLDIEKLIGELIGTGGQGGTSGGAGCITIRVCCDGGGTVSGPGAHTGGANLDKILDQLGGIVNQGARPFGASPQAVSPQGATPQGGAADPAATPPPIPPDASQTGEEARGSAGRQEERHQEIKGQLEGINTSLQQLVRIIAEEKGSAVEPAQADAG